MKSARHAHTKPAYQYKKLPYLEVGANDRRRPPPKGASWVTLVELEAMVSVPAGEEEGHTERPQTYTRSS